MIQPPAGMAECPKCNPCSPELDEDGRPYTCYFCCDVGWVTLAVAEEHERGRAEYAKRRMAQEEYDRSPTLGIDSDDHSVDSSGHFDPEIGARRPYYDGEAGGEDGCASYRRVSSAHAAVDYDDDIPF